MNYFNETPYRRYQEITEAVRQGQVHFTYNRATGYRIACQQRKSYALTFLYIPALTAVAIFILHRATHTKFKLQPVTPKS